MRMKWAASLGALGMVAAVSCTPPPATTKDPAPPKIAAFAPTVTSATSPALVTFKWTVSDPNHDDLTCEIDVDGDAAPDVTIRSCQGTGSYNVPLVAVDGLVTQHTLTLTVTDGVEVNGVVGTATKNATVTVTPGADEPFNITLMGVDDLDPESAAAFEAAADRWQRAIVSGLPDVPGSTLEVCGAPDGSTLPELVDDVLIYASIAPIDGPGTILGQAGPTCIMNGNQLTVIGNMEFDTDDVAAMKANGTLVPVILHEMGHVLGIGTLWDTTTWGSGTRALLSGAKTANPRFLGAAASAEYELLNNRSDQTEVPVENTGSPGTADSHWRESVFTTELMTGWMNPGAQMSAMTIASLADLGYNVDLSVADQFSLGGSAAARGLNSSLSGLTMLRPDIKVAGHN